MKKARKKRIVRRKRRFSEREVMRIKRKLKKSARKLRLGAKRTGAYVYGTLRKIVGNPAIPAHMGNPEFVREFRIGEMRARVSGEPVGLYAYRTKGGWGFITRKQSMYRPPGEELVVLFGEKRGLRGNPYPTGGMTPLERLRYHVSGAIARGEAKPITDLSGLVPRKPKIVRVLGYDVVEGSKKHMRLLAQKRHFDDLQRSERGLRGNPSFASLHPRDRATADKFVDYVYGFYGKGGLYAGDFGNRGFTRREIERAVAIYIDQIRRKKTQWGGGDSIDRERVRMILQPSYSMYIPEGRVTIRKNAERHPYWDSHELMRLYEVLRKTSPRSPYFKSTMGYIWRQLRVKPYQFRTKAKLLNEVRRRFIASQGYVR